MPGAGPFDFEGSGFRVNFMQSCTALGTSFPNTTGNPTSFKFDCGTNSCDYRARYYGPSVGRFTSEDPIGFDGGGDFYAYTRNRPVDLKDPFGLYHLQPGVPAPSGRLDMFLRCMDHYTNSNIEVTTTTNGFHVDVGHDLGTSVDQ
jgi:RHS repeat-associated protein